MKQVILNLKYHHTDSITLTTTMAAANVVAAASLHTLAANMILNQLLNGICVVQTWSGHGLNSISHAHAQHSCAKLI